MSGHDTNRWRGVVAVSLLAGAAGLVANQPVVLLLAVLGVAFGAYPRLTSAPEPELELERRVSDAAPRPGDEVDVAVTVRNVGERTLVDLRIVDGVPPALSVVDGTPRHGAALRPGAETTFGYTVEATHGKHGFEPATAVVRDLSGAHEAETRVAADTELDVTGASSRSPLRSQTVDLVGRLLTDQGGSGIEFYQTREYRPGDSMSRVDWNRYARSGELTTVEFRRERAATVAVLVDARAAAYRAAADEPHAVAHGVSAAKQLVSALAEGRNLVGVASFGRGLCWLAPGAGPDHAAQAQRFLSTHENFASLPPADEPPLDEQVAALRARLPNDAQVVLLSPLCDGDIVDAARSLDASGHAVTVLSPDVTSADTVGRRLARAERENRISALRAAGVPVVDWAPARPLAATLADAPRRGVA